MSAGAPADDRTILVVDDDKAYAAIVCDVLQEARYRVLVAHNALEALQINQTFSGRIDLVVVDLVMPLMSGIALAKRIQRKRPVRLLLMSGHPGANRSGWAAPADIAFMRKPVTRAHLLSTVQAVLDAPPWLTISLDRRR